MNIEIEKISKEDWAPLSENVHLIAFQKTKPQEWDRIDFALVCKKGPHLMGYMTCRELDAFSLYWQFGGAFPGTKNTSLCFLGYTKFVWWCKQHYKRISTIIENNNTVMLKMAMKVGFKIIGVRCVNGQIMLEHEMEFE